MRHRVLYAIVMMMSLVIAGCSSTNQQAQPDPSSAAQYGLDPELPEHLEDEVAKELPKGATMNGKGQVISKTGKVIGHVSDYVSKDVAKKLSRHQKNGQNVRSGQGAGQGGGQGGRKPGKPAVACNFEGCEGAPGVSAGTLKIGFTVLQNAGEAFAGLGAAVNTGSGKRQVKALVDDVNARGGIAGRKVEAVLGEFDLTKDARTQAAQHCTLFTEDQPVLAVITYGGSVGDLRECLADNHVFLFDHTFTSRDDKMLQELAPWFLTPSNKRESRVWQIEIPLLKRLGWFGRNPRVGLVTGDRPEYQRLADEVVKPLLSRVGVKVADEFNVTNFDPSLAQSQSGQAALRFKQNGITHVLFVPSYGSSINFMKHAENQRYRPRYAIDSSFVPATLLEPSAPKAQLRGSIGIGWNPSSDVADSRYQPYSPQEKRCFNLMRNAGEDVKSRKSPATALIYCNNFWAFEEAARRAGRNLTSGSLLGGYRDVGASWESVMTFYSDLSHGGPDGSYAHRILVFSDACDCFVYRGSVRKDPI